MERVARIYGATFGWLRLMLAPVHRYGVPPRSVVYLERFRTAATIVVAVLTTYLYTGFHQAERALASPVVNVLLALPAVLLAAVVLVAVTYRGQRRAVARSLLVPLSVAGAMILTLAVLAGLLQWLPRGLNGSVFGCCIAPLMMLALLCYGLPSMLWASYLTVRHWFRGADGHPMLPALITIGFALAQGVVLIVRGPDDDFPAVVGWVLGIGAPVGLAATAVLELLLLGAAGFSLRNLPPLRVSPAPPPGYWPI